MPDFNANNTFLERPGNFKVTDIHIIPYHREGRDEGLYRQIITDQVLGFNIYESMTSHFLSGDMTIIDGVNLINMLPLTGFERLEFKLYTHRDSRFLKFSKLEKNLHEYPTSVLPRYKNRNFVRIFEINRVDIP